ncbi:MAG TPA: nuclear transport factor 2 family protein [Terriglobales bacterium]|nr:nuclear transport factor 2 family protein [Terriglobales bacterium]
MTPNQQTVANYMDAFNRSDDAAILACLTDDVSWIMPGFFHLEGKAAFAKEIHNEAFVGRPTIVTTRVTEGNNVVVSEGTVTCARKDGGTLNAVFCDVFVMRNAKIQQLTSYLMELKS